MGKLMLGSTKFSNIYSGQFLDFFMTIKENKQSSVEHHQQKQLCIVDSSNN